MSIFNDALLVEFQTLENYGAHAEDGKAINGNARWKFKPGATVLVQNMDTEQNALALATALKMTNEIDWKEFPIKWEVVANDYQTEYELYQIEEYGKVKWPATRVDMNDYLPGPKEVA